MKNRKIMSMLSICQKAGKIVSGEFAVEKSLQDGSSFLVLIAEDASNNTKKKFENKTFFYKVDCIKYSTKVEISQAIGKLNRSVFSIIDEGFAKKIKEDINNL